MTRPHPKGQLTGELQPGSQGDLGCVSRRERKESFFRQGTWRSSARRDRAFPIRTKGPPLDIYHSYINQESPRAGEMAKHPLLV